MERHEAEAIYDAGRERCVDFILALDARYERLEARVAELEQRLNRSSRNSSLPPARQAGLGSRAGRPARLADGIRSASAVDVDETGWRVAGERRTLWGALTPQAALFRIAANRHEREAKALLGEPFAGIACSDRWWAYDYLNPERRQLCWAHLVRDFTAHSEGLAAQKAFGAATSSTARSPSAANGCSRPRSPVDVRERRRRRADQQPRRARPARRPRRSS